MDMTPIKQMETLLRLFREYLSADEQAPKVGQKGPDSSDDWTTSFAAWILKRESRPETHASMEPQENFIGPLLLSLVNVARNITATFLKTTPLANIMEYQFLTILKYHGRQSKSGIIEMNGMEMSPGIEIIRRLIKNGWVEEEGNPLDRRSKYISITDRGKALLERLAPEVKRLYEALSGGFEAEERARIERALEALAHRLSVR